MILLLLTDPSGYRHTTLPMSGAISDNRNTGTPDDRWLAGNIVDSYGSGRVNDQFGSGVIL